MEDFWLYVFAGAIGGAVGLTELVARYRDDPVRAIATFPGLLYLFANTTASLLALWLVLNVFPESVGSAHDTEIVKATTRVAVAGFGAMAFFRASLFTLRVGDSDLEVGPSAILRVILNAADRAVDRRMANRRFVVVGEIMKSVSFERAHITLPTYCFAGMQNVTSDEQAQFGMQINALAQTDMEKSTKALNLGLALLNLVGEDVLRTAVQNLHDDIREPDDA